MNSRELRVKMNEESGKVSSVLPFAKIIATIKINAQKVKKKKTNYFICVYKLWFELPHNS